MTMQGCWSLLEQYDAPLLMQHYEMTVAKGAGYKIYMQKLF
jgi:hypothetical protein